MATSVPPPPRPLTVAAQPSISRVDHEPRPIIGSSGSGSIEISKMFEHHHQLQQQRLHHMHQASMLPPHISTPIARPVGATQAPPPPFMPITPGRIPMQAASPVTMQSALLMQQLGRGELPRDEKRKCMKRPAFIDGNISFFIFYLF